MVTRHLSNKEFDLLLTEKKEALSSDTLSHVESCQQCRQEFSELSALFQWPAGIKSDHSAKELTEQVFALLARRTRAIWAKRGIVTLVVIAGLGILFSMASTLWQYLPSEIRTTATGLFPVMEWMESFNSAIGATWFSSSAIYVLLGGLFVLSCIMLADSMVISRLIRRMRPTRRSIPLSQKQAAQGNRT